MRDVLADLAASGITALLAFGTLDGPLAEPVEAEIRDGRMTVQAKDWEQTAAVVVDP